MALVTLIFTMGISAALSHMDAHKLLDEPDYQHLLYGSVWRHMIFTPSPVNMDIMEASKHVQSYLGSSDWNVSFENAGLQCISRSDLWFTLSEHYPYLMDSRTSGKKGQEYPMSVPVSVGSLFNFLIRVPENDSSTTTHTVTLSRAELGAPFYFYSHTFYSVTDHCNREEENVQYCSCTFERPIEESFAVISNLALSRHSTHYPGNRCEFQPDITKDERHKYLRDSNLQTNVSDKDVEFKNFKIMTYNIWNFNSQVEGKYHQRMKRISQLLKTSRPDIVGFQEVRFEQSSGGKLGPSQIQHLSSILPGYQFVYQPAQLLRETFHQGRSEEGLAIFSRYPIIHHDYLLLFRNRQNSADGHQRICLHVVVNVPFVGRVHVYNTHMSLSHEAREAAVTQILDFIQSGAHAGEPVFLLGDLNATPEELAVRMISKNSGVIDVWNFLHPSSLGMTYNALEDDLSKRIDYVFMRKLPNMTALKIDVLQDQTKSEAASDHRAVMATFGFDT